MELPLPPMHPKTPRLLENLGLRAVDAVKWNLLLCVKRDDSGSAPTHVLKFGIDPRKTKSLAYETRILQEVLPTIRSNDFKCLVLPELISAGENDEVSWLLTQYIPGEPLVHRWSELSFKPDILGGKGLDEDVAVKSVCVLRDLRVADITQMPDFVRRFSFAEWLTKFLERSGQLKRQGFMEQPIIDEALKVFSDKKVERYEGSMFTNGDFYPRNFILLPDGKVAVVDWVGGVDPWEFVAMHAWLMMWGNTKWQARYLHELKKHFPIDEEEMRIGLLVKAFDRVWLWREESEMDIGFARTQMLSYFRQCLDLDYVRQIFG